MVSVTDRHQLATIFGWWQSFVSGFGGFSELGLSFVAFLATAFYVEEEGRFKMVGGRASKLLVVELPSWSRTPSSFRLCSRRLI